MRRMSPALKFPACHLSQVRSPERGGPAVPVWICEYPYRTMRLTGPSSDCADCPVWQAMEQTRQRVRQAQTAEEVQTLEAMIAS